MDRQLRYALLWLLAAVLLILILPGKLIDGERTSLIGQIVRELSHPPEVTHSYIAVTDSCSYEYEGDCVVLRAAATTSAPVVLPLRTGVVLPIATTTVADETGRQWYRIAFNEWIRYPGRLAPELFVATDVVERFANGGAEEALIGFVASTSKRILIDRSEQKLYAYEGDELYMETTISTGLDLTPTPRGMFSVYRKTPSRYMQGPLPGISYDYYDLPGVPWNLYFTAEGGAIHGAYWHNGFGTQWSHGCVNLPIDASKKLYDWTPLGTPVTVQD